MELLQKLGIDWRLLFAQAINFTILLFVLHRFLYHPIIDILEKRKKQVEDNDQRTKDLEERMTNAERAYKDRLIEAEKQARDIIIQSENSAKKVKEEILMRTEIEAANVIIDAKRQAEHLHAETIAAVRAEANELIERGVKKILSSIASHGVTEDLLKKVDREIKALD